MDDNSMSIDLKKLKRHQPAAPIEVPPLGATADLSRRPAPAYTPPVAAVSAPAYTPPAARSVSAPAPVMTPPKAPPILPPRPKMTRGFGGFGKMAFRLPSLMYLFIALVVAVGLAAGGYYIYVHV